MITSDPTVVRRQNLDALRESRGWAEEIVPALNKRIASLEKSLLDADHPLAPEETRRAREERQYLIWMRDTPDRLIQHLEANARQTRRPASPIPVETI